MTNLIVSSALHVAPLLLAGILALTFAAPAYANNLACKDYPIITPDTAQVDHSRIDKSGVSNLNGTAWTKMAYCPAGAAANNTCTGETLSERVPTTQYDWTTYDGNVDDIERHRNGIKIGNTFIPLTGYIPGACA
jgi:hypothetical protein